MARVIEVADPADTRLADFRDLSRADRRPDRPGGRGFVIAEGTVVVRRLIASAYPVRAVLGVARRVESLESELAGLPVPAYVTSAEVMTQVVGFHLNRGVLAVADRAAQPAPDRLVESSRVLAVLEGVGDHENLGALFRNAAALGVHGVLLGPGCADPLYRRSVRVSMGHVLAVPFASIAAQPAGPGPPFGPWPGGVKWLRDKGFRVLALTPDGGAVVLADAIGPAGRVALMLGSEGPGLSREAVAAADLAVRIPMATGVDSLNVATAAAVAFYALRAAGRRQESGGGG
jgi:tRNA G18 (ribose-2'-O)-methylase SpoU